MLKERMLIGGPRHGETTLHNNQRLTKWANPQPGPTPTKVGYYQQNGSGNYDWIAPPGDSLTASACRWS